jgi:hypothetical protein
MNINSLHLARVKILISFSIHLPMYVHPHGECVPSLRPRPQYDRSSTTKQQRNPITQLLFIELELTTNVPLLTNEEVV